MMAANCKPRCAKLVVLVIAGIAALGAVVMLLWNWLVPELFMGGRQIDYWQALGVLLLSKILFGGFRGHGGPGRWHRERWERLTPEEQAKLREGLHRCLGGDDAQDTEHGRP